MPPSRWKWVERIRKVFGRKNRTIILANDWRRNVPIVPPKITFTRNSNGKLFGIGGSHHGRIYLGRAKFEGKKPVRVAIKVFTREALFHFKTWSDDWATDYNIVISILQQWGVRLPKMGVIRTNLPGESEPSFVLVSQLFGATRRGGKIINKSHEKGFSKRARKDAVAEYTKIANAGFIPARDVVEPFIDGKKGSIPIDIDMLVVEYMIRRREKKTSSISFGTRQQNRRKN